MNLINNLKERFGQNQLILILICASLAFPYYICVPLLLIETLYLFFTKKAIISLQATPKIKYLYLFLGLTMIVSLFYQNWIGAGCTILIAMFITLMVYFRQYITPDLFSFILDMFILFSIFWAVYGLYEQLMILHRLGYGLTLKVFSRRENRLNSVFMNANYYAMMIEFLLLSLMYQFFKHIDDIKRCIYYVIVGLLNLFLLYMTGCRTAIIALAFAVIVFFIINKNFRLCILIATLSLFMGGFFLINPDKFPRVERLVTNLDVRLKIWRCAIKGIQAHPLFGEGPMTYMKIYKLYGGHITQHAHSVYLDPILSFGFVGIIPGIVYIVDNCKRLIRFYKTKFDTTYVALVVSMVIVIFLHGTLDYTIFWIHTGLYFMFIASSFEMKKNQDRL